MNDAQRRVTEQQRLSGANRLWNALTSLKHVGSFMNCGAHPDDERSHILAYLARNQGIQVMYSTATRGKGGQNAIGTEAGDDLGVFRSEEMNASASEIPMSVHYYSARFGDEIDDFGFSTDPSEAEAKWGVERTRERLVRIIREQKPDILSPTFLDTDGQHGHHRAVTRATLDAYDMAADPEAFPEQIEEGLRPWQVKKLYLSAASGRGGVYDDRDPPPDPTVSIPVGMMDPIAGATYRQMGEWSRVRHLTQGMGRWYDAAPEDAHLHRLRSEVDIPLTEDDIFDGLPKTLGDLAKTMTIGGIEEHLTEADQNIKAAIDAFPDQDKVHENLLKVHASFEAIMQRLSIIPMSAVESWIHKLDLKRRQLRTAIFVASGLQAELTWDNNFISPGQELTGKISLYNTGSRNTPPMGLAVFGTKPSEPQFIDISNVRLRPGEQEDIEITHSVEADADYHNPLQKDYDPFRDIEVFSCFIGSNEGSDILLSATPALIVPPVSLNWEASGLYFNRLTDGDPVQATLSVEKLTDVRSDVEIGLEAPAGWTVMPPKYVVPAGELSKSSKYEFVINGPTGSDRIEMTPYAICDGKRVTENVRMMDYDHIRNTCKIMPATFAVQPVDLDIPARLNVGYVDRGADRVHFWLRRFGVNVTMLSVDDLKAQNLSQYDTIMIGIRAFAEDLTAASPALRQYVENGGNLVTQYNRTDDDWDNETTPPRPITIGSPSFRWRITDPDAVVTHLIADHHLLNAPNQIDESDWANWHQERGLYFVSESSSEYEFLLSMSDHGKDPLTGGLISASIGQGWHHHCSLILHHQLEHQVAGAARLLANLITPPDWK